MHCKHTITQSNTNCILFVIWSDPLFSSVCSALCFTCFNASLHSSMCYATRIPCNPRPRIGHNLMQQFLKNAKKCKEPSVSPLRHVLLDISDQASQRFKKRPVAFPCLFCFIVYQMSSNAISDICFFHIISSDCIVIILIIPPTSISRTTLSS